MRLDAFISQNSDYSRSQIQILIKHGRVRLGENLALKGAHKISAQDIVYVDDQPLSPQGLRYFMLHKPAGYVCANSDSEHPTVLDLLTDIARKSSLQIAGRLDIDTTGLVLLTDDGAWNHRITAPRRECSKRYRVTTADPISAETGPRFLAGVLLHGETQATRPAQLTPIDSHSAWLDIHEGKYHQVKRMFAALGNRVTSLHRETIGSIVLDPALAPGSYRPLHHREIQLEPTPHE